MILFIHPKTDMLLRDILPMSLPALMNRLPGPVVGRFHDEWTPADVKAARVVVMDIHWYLSLKSAIVLSRRLKQLNPECVIIAGGLSASLFAHQLLRDSRIDYIIRGDGERPLVRLVDAILTGTSPAGIPNLVSHAGVSPMTYAVSTLDMDGSNYRDLSFFPSLERRVLRYHAIYTTPVTLPTFPYLVVFRGCPLECPSCCGSIEMQGRLFNRGFVLRSAERVAEDLACWSQDPRLRFVNVFHDFLTTTPRAYSAQLLSERYRLHVSYDFFSLPAAEELELLLGAFLGGKIHFPLAQQHGAARDPVDPSSLIRRIRRVQSTGTYEVVLTYVKRYLSDPRYREAFQAVVTETRVSPCQVDYWWEDFPVPDEHGSGSDASYRACLSWSRKYFLMNMLFRAGVLAYRFAPSLTKSLSHWYFS